MYNVTRLLISLALFWLIRRAQQAGQPYYCREKDFIELGAPHVKIHRFVSYENVLYIVLDEKIILLRLPKIHRVPTNNGDRLNYLSSLPFFVENKFKAKGDGKPVALNIISTSEKSQVEEISLSNPFQDLPWVDVRPLKFDGPVPAVDTGNSISFAAKEHYGSYTVKFKNNRSFFIFQYEGFNLAMNLTDDQSDKPVQLKFDLSYEVEKAIFFADDQSENNSLIELDKQHNMHIKEFDFKALLAEPPSSKPAEISVPLVDLLNCHRRLTKLDQVKGIFFNEQQDVTYLFIDHFYIRFYEDLIKKSLFINYQKLKAYRENEFDLQFYKQDLAVPEMVTFENTPFGRWVKTEKTSVYFTTTDQVFRITADSSDQIQLKWVEKPLFSKCLRQTLVVEDVLFCFHSKSYYKLSEANENLERFKIKDLFVSAPFRHFDGDERLELIFDYKDNGVVFMTQNHLFLLYYDFFGLDQNKTLIFKYVAQHDNKVASIRKNCLLSAESHECKKSKIVGPQKIHPVLYIFVLLPLIGIAFVVGVYFSVGRYAGRRETSFTLNKSRSKAFFQEKKAAASPRNRPKTTISQTDTYSQSQTIEVKPVVRRAKAQKLRQTGGAKPVKLIPGNSDPYIKRLERAENRRKTGR